MGTVVIVCGALVVSVGIPVLGWWAERRQARRVRLRRAVGHRRTTAIAALREGERAKVRGVVAAREPLLTSPISGRACVGYQIAIDDVSHDPKLVWTPLVSRHAWSSFLVEDETGTVAVQGILDVALAPTAFASQVNIPPAVYNLLAEDDVRVQDLWGPREFWFKETLLRVGDRVSVVGRPSLEIDPAGDGSFREPPRRCVMRGSMDEPVAVIDEEEARPSSTAVRP